MTLTKGIFYCIECDITWSDDYEPQAKPRRSCYKCHKSCHLKAKSRSLLPPEAEGLQEGKAKIPPLTNGKVDETLIEKAILDLYDNGSNSPNLVRSMIDYVLKIKGKQEEIDDDLDLEMLKEIGIAIESEDSN